MKSRGRTRRYVLVLSLLLAAFVGRVLAQLLQVWMPLPWLPPFEAWHSGLLPYPLLVASQIVIIVVELKVIAAMSQGSTPSRRLGRPLLALGGFYFATMVARLVLGLTVFRHVRWFDAHLPTAFHLVLASFLLMLGAFHLSAQDN